MTILITAVFVSSVFQVYLLLKMIRVADSIAKEFDDAYCRQLEEQIDVLERKSFLRTENFNENYRLEHPKGWR
jgi:hypothetical protein